MKTITDLLTIRNASDPRSRELLLAHVLAKPREWVLTHPGTAVRPSQAARYRRLLRRHVGTLPTPTRSPSRWEGEKDGEGEPLPYLLGERWFYGRPFIVNRNVLIPRPESELLIELVLQHQKINRTPTHSPSQRGGEKEGVSEPLIVDIGTGSGCIAVTLASEIPQTRIIATDVSRTALRVACANARRHEVVDRITFLRGDLLSPRVISRARPEKSHTVHGVRSLDFAPTGRSARDDATMVVLANLPYLTTAEWHALPRSIRDYEPREALDGGPDGLKYYRELFAQLVGLTPYALRLTALLEIDPRRKHTLTALVRKTLPDWRASWHRDLAHRWRVLALQPKSNPRNSSTRNPSTHHGPTVYDPAGPRSPARSW